MSFYATAFIANHVIADREGKKWFYVFYDPTIVATMHGYFHKISHYMIGTGNSFFCVFNKVARLSLRKT